MIGSRSVLAGLLFSIAATAGGTLAFAGSSKTSAAQAPVTHAQPEASATHDGYKVTFNRDIAPIIFQQLCALSSAG